MWWKRYKEAGLDAMREGSRRPKFYPHKTSKLWKDRVIDLKKRYRWGAKKLRQILLTKYGSAGLPVVSTFGSILFEEGLVKARRRRNKWPRMPLVEHRLAVSPTIVWAVDFKGWFRTGDGTRCDPLTVSDLYSRFLLCCRLVESQSFEMVKPVFEELFKLYGLPQNIRSDNGSPFGSAGVIGLLKLSIWFLTLGIRPEFIEPGHPEQNGSHERMHRNLKAETTKPPSRTWQGQQGRMQQWRQEYNTERPHEALDQKLPVDFYLSSQRQYRVQPIIYPSVYQTRRVEEHGQIRWNGTKYFVGNAFAHQLMGLKALESHRFEVYFSDRLLGELNTADSSCKGLAPCMKSKYQNT